VETAFKTAFGTGKNHFGHKGSRWLREREWQ
jgi:hypothetical protein